MAQVDPSAEPTSRSYVHCDAAAALQPTLAQQLARRWRRSRNDGERRPHWRFRVSRRLCLGMALSSLAVTAPAKQAESPTSHAGGLQQGGAGGSLHGAQDQDPMPHHVEEHMVERRNSDRQKALVADTEKLLALAQQLKLDVDKSNKDMLSVDVVRRAEQIEKLARSVKEKMRGN